MSDEEKIDFVAFLLFLVERQAPNPGRAQLMRLGYWRQAKAALGIRPGRPLRALP
jgi:hypothetical protein